MAKWDYSRPGTKFYKQLLRFDPCVFCGTTSPRRVSAKKLAKMNRGERKSLQFRTVDHIHPRNQDAAGLL